MERIKVGIVEDEIIIAETIRLALLKLNYTPIRATNSYASTVKMLEEEKPALLLLDINLNDELDGIDIAHYVNENYEIPFVFLTANSDRSTIERAKQKRPAAFLVKPFGNDDLLSAIEIALFNHESRKNEAMLTKQNLLLKSMVKYELTAREEEIMLQVSGGLRQKEIAHKLFISESTVKKHLYNLYQKLGVQSSIDALNKLLQG